MTTLDTTEPLVVSSLLHIRDEHDEPLAIHIRRGKPIIIKNNDTPYVVLLSGLGSPALIYSNIQRLLAERGIPSLSFDRAGLGRSSALPLITPSFSAPTGDRPDDLNDKDDSRTSTAAPRARLAADLADELDAVLTAAKVPAPYILVAHSAAGLTVWEYAGRSIQQANDIAGIVFLDANSPMAMYRAIRDPDLDCLSDGIVGEQLDYSEIVGLNAASTLPDDEWDEIFGRRPPPEGWQSSANGAWAEMLGWEQSCRDVECQKLTDVHPLADHPITVIMGFTEGDIRKYVAEAERRGGGTQEQRDDLRKRLQGADAFEEKCQREHLKLTASGEQRFVRAENSGHYPHINDQALVVDEIMRMVEQIRVASRSS